MHWSKSMHVYILSFYVALYLTLCSILNLFLSLFLPRYLAPLSLELAKTSA